MVCVVDHGERFQMSLCSLESASIYTIFNGGVVSGELPGSQSEKLAADFASRASECLHEQVRCVWGDSDDLIHAGSSSSNSSSSSSRS